MNMSIIALMSGALVSLSVVSAAENSSGFHVNNKPLTLIGAVQNAQANDLWLLGNQHAEDSAMSLSVASGTLPDPRVFIGIANLATDTFDFDQERMTQLNVGVSQVFPRGDSLNIKKQQLVLMSGQYPYQRQNRKARVVVTVAQLWLDAYKAQESIALIEKDRSLFEQLVDVTEASYSSALGRARQQDVVRAQLELTRLDDRLSVLNQHRDVALKALAQWRSIYFLPQSSEVGISNVLGLERILIPQGLSLDKFLPDISLLKPDLYVNATETAPKILYQYMVQHAVVQSLEQKIKAYRIGIKLAQQKYKPEWKVSASYGYRDDDPLGKGRADLFSVGVSFDVPLFTRNKQDKEVQSAISLAEAVRTEKWLLLRKLMASFEVKKAQLLRLNERRNLYYSQLLPQMHDQASASLIAYTNDDGDFSEVIRARIAELNAKIDALSIDVDRQKMRVQLNYFFMNNANEIVAGRISKIPMETHHEE